jgi:hypothetical protein
MACKPPANSPPEIAPAIADKPTPGTATRRADDDGSNRFLCFKDDDNDEEVLKEVPILGC